MRYKDSGVDIDAGNAFVDDIKPLVKETANAGVMGVIGGFGGLYDIKSAGFNDPVLVAATDGVGTKLLLARDANKHDTIGIDLVAMCTNDLLAQGAKPLFFLDYFATGKLERREAAEVVKGICEGCKQAGAALIGGETAEMPGLYAPGHYDLAGFSVGAVERSHLLPRPTTPGNILIGLSSSGVHANGFSLVRKILSDTGKALNSPLYEGDDTDTASVFLAPTVIYENAVRPAINASHIHALAHITGGGITENIPRILSEGVGVDINLSALQPQDMFRWLADNGDITEDDMLRTFNCGVGMVLVCPEAQAETVIADISTRYPDMRPRIIGHTIEDDGKGIHYSGKLFV